MDFGPGPYSTHVASKVIRMIRISSRFVSSNLA